MIRSLLFARLRRNSILLAALLLAGFSVTHAQELKLGSNPTVINKASILELESTTRGLLLPRIPDTSAAPLTASPDGMVIYFTVDSSLYVRKGGAWQKVVDRNNLYRQLGPAGGDLTGTYPNPQIAPAAVTTAKLADGSVVTVKIADANVTTAKIADGNVTYAKIQPVSTQYSLLGRYGTAPGPVQEVSLGSGISMSNAGVLSATGNGGTVTSVSASVPAGLSVNVTNPTTTPNIAITTTLNGPVRGTGSGFTTGNTSLTSEVSGILPIANGGTGLGTLGTTGQQLRVNTAANGLEYFTTSGTAPITYNSGAIGITQATTTTNGYLSSTDWNIFNNKAAAFTKGNLTEAGSSILTITGGTNAVIGSGTTLQVKQASGTQNGFLSSADWTTFNNKLSTVDTTNITNFSVKVRSLFSGTTPITLNAATGAIGIPQANATTPGFLSAADWATFNSKQGAITTGNFTETGSNILTITGGTGSQVGGNTTVQVKQANGTQSGFLSNTDWTTFNSKANAFTTGNFTETGSNILTITGGANSQVGGNTTVQVKQASGTQSGFLSAADWTTFNNKLSTVDTTNITNFSVKVRSLFSGTAPIILNAATGAIGLPQANGTTSGYLSAADWATFNSKQGAITTGNLTETGSSILTITGGSNAVVGSGTSLQVKQASGTQSGFLSNTDWNTFNSKANAFTTGNLTETGSNILTITGGTGAQVGGNTTVQVKQANGTQAGFLSAADWTTFNNKLSTVDTTNITNFSVKVRSLFSGTTPITLNAATGAIGIPQANATTPGFLSAADWATFNAKQGAITTGNFTETSSNVLTITGGNNAVVGSGTSVQVKQASGTQAGFLSAADWTTFNNKLGTVDTTNITNFSVKVRGLFSGTTPITFNAATGAIGIPQANTTTNGFLSNTDWNTFNNKLSTVDTTNINQFSVKVRSLFAAGTGLTYNAATGTFTNSAASTFWQYGGNAVTANQNLGTTSAFDLPIITSGTERMRILSTGNVGIGMTNPAYPLGVMSNMEIRRAAGATAVSQMLFTNVAGTGDFRIGSDGNDIYWQGGGGRNLEMGAYWGTFLTGDRQASSFPALVNGTSGTAVTAFSSRAASVPLAVVGASGQTANLQEWRSNSGTLNIMNSTGNLAIGATAFDGTNPEKVLINAGTTTSVNALYMKGTINNYFQANIRNLSTGNLASSDLVATADNGTETTNFMDIGINGSGYVYQNGAAIETGKANDTYILAAGNDLYIVNNNASKSIIFLSGGTASTDESMRITANNRVGIATSNPTDTLTVAGPFRMGANGTRLNGILKANVATTAVNITTNGGNADFTLAFPNATVGATVAVSPLAPLPAGIVVAFTYVPSAGNVFIRLTNANVNLLGLATTTAVSATTFAVTVTQ